MENSTEIIFLFILLHESDRKITFYEILRFSKLFYTKWDYNISDYTCDIIFYAYCILIYYKIIKFTSVLYVTAFFVFF